jgi:L,D-transpeptidase YcbB
MTEDPTLFGMRGGRFGARAWGAWILIVSLALAAGACHASSSGQSSESDELRRNKNVDLVDALEFNLPELLRQEAVSRANTLSIDAILEPPGQRAEQAHLSHPGYLRQLYKERGFEPLWVRVEGTEARLSPAADELLEVLREGASVHGMWYDELHLDKLDALELPRDARQPGEVFSDLELGEAERDAILEWLADRDEVYDVDTDLQRVVGELVDAGRPLERFVAPVEERVARLSRSASESARADVMLSDAMIHYALEMRLDNPAWHRAHDWPQWLRPPEPAEEAEAPAPAEEAEDVVQEADDADEDEKLLSGDELEHARRDHLVMQTLGPVFEEPSRAASVLTKLIPPHEPYRRLTDAFQTYASIVEQGGWPVIDAAAEGLKRGASSEHISVVKERLRMEGYFQEDDDSPEFTNTLRRAILRYQQTHQLWENGWLTPETMSSINVTALERWNQIRVTLDRWRDSRIGPDEHYVLVNIPDFHASVWRDGERKMYFKTVVGKTKREKNDDGEVIFKRATPRFSDQISYIVFNPYWNVPKSIEKETLEPKFLEDFDYFDEEGYEYYTAPNGHVILRQKPGPTNALGRVKFLFPNQYNVYLHDTPDQHLLDHPFRAYSSGCVRIEDALEFAHYLLDHDGRLMDEERREEILEEWFEKDGDTYVKLRNPVPIHLEYYVVRVDDDGHANFLADLYRLDRPRMAEVQARLEQLEYPYGTRFAEAGETGGEPSESSSPE